jgi:hypothetical protein
MAKAIHQLQNSWVIWELKHVTDVSNHNYLSYCLIAHGKKFIFFRAKNMQML